MGKRNNQLVDRVLNTGTVKFADLSLGELNGAQKCFARRADRLKSSPVRQAEQAMLSRWSLRFKDEMTARQNRSICNRPKMSIVEVDAYDNIGGDLGDFGATVVVGPFPKDQQHILLEAAA